MNDTISRSNCDLFMNDTISRSNYDLFMNDTISRSNCDLFMNDTISRSNYDLFMNQMSFTIVNNTICPDWYLNLGPLDLQSNTLPLCHGGCWQLVLITLVGLFNDSFAISRTAYLFLSAMLLPL